MDELTARTVLALSESLNRVLGENIYQREVIRGLEGQVAGLKARLGEGESIVYRPDGHPNRRNDHEQHK